MNLGHMVLEEQAGTWRIMRLCQKDLRTNLKRLTKAKFGVILAFFKKSINDNNTQLDVLIEKKKESVSPYYRGIWEMRQGGGDSGKSMKASHLSQIPCPVHPFHLAVADLHPFFIN